LGSPRTGVIAHVHPETSISKQQTHQSGEPNWLYYTVPKLHWLTRRILSQSVITVTIYGKLRVSE